MKMKQTLLCSLLLLSVLPMIIADNSTNTSFNMTSFLNITFNLTANHTSYYFCNETANITMRCSHNESLCNQSITKDMIKAQNITISFNESLGPGESKTGSFQDICFFNLNCTKCPSCDQDSVQDICIIDKTISPNQHFRRESAGCNVNVTCEACSSNDCEDQFQRVVENYTVDFEVRIEYEYDNLTVVLLRDDKPYWRRRHVPLDRNISSMTLSIDDTFECPVFNSSLWHNLTFEQCNKYFPLMNTFDNQVNMFQHYTSSLLMMQSQSYNVTNELIECQSELTARSREKEDVQGDYQTCSVQIEAERSKLDSMKQSCEDSKSGLYRELDDLKDSQKIDAKLSKPINFTKNLALGVLSIYSLILTVVMIKYAS